MTRDNSRNGTGAALESPSKHRPVSSRSEIDPAASSGLKRESGTRHGIGPTSVPVEAARISALDFTKGALVLIMVLYHWINYFIGPDWPYYPYLRFLTPSFILVSGFLISRVYLSKHKVAYWHLSKRLLTRGLKLLCVFVVLNLIRISVLARLSNTSSITDQLDLDNLAEVFLAGYVSTAAGKLIGFYILVSISYLLILSAGLVLLHRYFRYTFHAACALSLLGILALDLSGLKSYNLEFVTVGLVGVLLGLITHETINSLVSHWYWLAVAYICYLIAITFWNVPFALLIVGACLSVGTLYLVGLKGGDNPTMTRKKVVLLGQYSLFGYVAQIAILQILSAGLRHIKIGSAILGLSLLAAFALTMLAVEGLERIRARSKTINGLYRAVFA